MTNLTPLIEKIESAAEGSRELDAEIAVAVQYDLPAPMGCCTARLELPRGDEPIPCTPGTYWLVQRSGSSLRTAPEFSTSLDAALSLLPEGWVYTVSNSGDVAFCWEPIGTSRHGRWKEGRASTPALALLSAILKAIQAEKNDA